ncbi:CDP-alcohol phosphatidyltransferase family protein [Tessaracoccus caeni]|uniref:CDP-alcohol phosphatidyltransferase family protein n=1 Tax=Tessaracoccus caeni TaxID=3031239 RepID=UPI0023DA73B3|nr:CDP-alcohol phosphatidyltransferase family protein [Tessaracoccus caeni]MDF1489933.1 CDP-alcohol phosphatidyltransferase family protein [Tessaracoccus caeni]
MTEPEERPKKPTMAQLRQVVQTDEVMARSAEHWTGTLYMRRLSINLTYLLVRTPITANGVTGLMIVVGILAGPALLLPGFWGPLAAVLCTQLQMFLDCCDGEVARWRRSMSPKGILLDQIGHFTAEASIGIFIGVKAAALLGPGAATTGDWYYAFLGGVLAVGISFNKGLNLMVTVARTNAGLGALPDTTAARGMTGGGALVQLRRVARFVPFHRIFHSIELTLVTLVLGAAALLFPDQLSIWRGYVTVLAVLIWVVSLGHFLAIWRSPKLRVQA